MRAFKFIKYTVICAALLQAVTPSAFAEKGIIVKTNADAKTVMIEGSFEDSPNETFAVYVLNPGKSSEDLSAVQKKDLLSYFNLAEQVYTDEEGGFTLTYKMTGKSGHYNIYAVKADGSVKVNESFFWIESAEEYVEKIETARKKYLECRSKDDSKGMENAAGEIKTVLENQDIRGALGIDDTEIPQKTEFEALPDMTFKLMAESSTAYIKTEDVRKTFFNSIFVCAFDSAEKEEFGGLFEAYGTRLPGFNEKIYGKYIELQKNEKTAFDVVNTALASREFTSASDISDALTSETVLAYVKKMNHYSEFMPFIQDTDNVIGLDLELYNTIKSSRKSESVLKAVILNKGNYKEVSDIVNYFKDCTKKELNAEIDASGGGSVKSSGGGGSYNGIKAAVMPETQAEALKPDAQTAVFVDLPKEHWAYDSVTALAEKGIISGDDTGTFRPADSVKREELLKTALLIFGIEDADASADFTDISADDWFYPYVAFAQKRGYITGYDDGRFGAGDFITRQDMAVIIYHITSSNDVAFASDCQISFRDFNEISDYAKTAVRSLAGNGIIVGTDAGEFEPNSFCTRAEMAAVIQRILELAN